MSPVPEVVETAGPGLDNETIGDGSGVQQVEGGGKTGSSRKLAQQMIVNQEGDDNQGDNGTARGAQPSATDSGNEGFPESDDGRSMDSSKGRPSSGGGGGVGSGSKRRNPKQQQQNKLAQQRYRAKRKAQFEQLQGTVEVLNSEIQKLEREKMARQEAELRIMRQRTGMMSVPGAYGGMPDGIMAAGPMLRPPVVISSTPAVGLPNAIHAIPRRVSMNINTPHSPTHPQEDIKHLLQALAQQPGPSMSMPPPPPPPQIATMPSLAAPMSMQPPASQRPSSTDVPSSSEQPTSPGQIRNLLDIFCQEVSRFVASNGLDRAPPMPGHLSPALAAQITQLLQMGSDMIALVLQLGGASATAVLQNGAAPSVPNIADDVQRWQAVVAAVAPTPEQVEQIAAWKICFLRDLDACYTRRVALKSQALQSLGHTPGSGDPVNWAEGLLLQAAGTQGYALPALSVAELLEAVESLQKSVKEERSMAIAASMQLMRSILTPVQALRYLTSSHPFSWNALAFAHAVGAAYPPPPS